jgi:hypothetical protein
MSIKQDATAPSVPATVVLVMFGTVRLVDMLLSLLLLLLLFALLLLLPAAGWVARARSLTMLMLPSMQTPAG